MNRQQLKDEAIDVVSTRYKIHDSIKTDADKRKFVADHREEVKTVMRDLYYLHIAQDVLSRSTCLRRNYGAVIVKDDRIVSCGYNGAPAGETNCSDLGYCARQAMGVPAGQRYELCVACHAEENSIINASKEEMKGATIYCWSKH